MLPVVVERSLILARALSLVAEVDGAFAGFLQPRVFHGEFGAVAPSATLDTIGVHPGFRGRGVGRALPGQPRTNRLGPGIRVLRTEAAWSDAALVDFFRASGFLPAPRPCLDLDVEERRRAEERG